MERERRQEREYNENQLEGRNAVLEVLRSGRDIEKLIVQKGNIEGTIKRIVAMAAEKGVLIQETTSLRLYYRNPVLLEAILFCLPEF